jgi:hypothetical protein
MPFDAAGNNAHVAAPHVRRTPWLLWTSGKKVRQFSDRACVRVDAAKRGTQNHCASAAAMFL